MPQASARQTVTTLVERGRSARQSVSRLSVPASPRQSVSSLAAPQASPRQSVSRLFGEDFHAFTIALNAETWIQQKRQIAPYPAINLVYAGHDLSGLLGDVQISRPLNGKAQIQFDLRTPGGPVVPLQSDLCPPGYGPYAGQIRQHNGTRDREFAFSVQLAGETWQAPPFLPLPVRWDNRLTWGGEDLTALLETERDPDDESAPFDDILRSEGDLVTAHQAAAQASAALGIPIECRYPNYLIGVLRRGGGTILSWLDALAKPMQAARRWVGGRLVYEQVNPNAAPSWRFVDRLNIQTMSIEELPRPRNKFVLARFDPSGGIIGEASETGGGALGRKRISFTPTKNVVIDVHKVLQGRLDDWVFEAGGNPLNVTPWQRGVYSNQTPADGASFTYYPNIMQGAGQWQPSFDITARGTNLPRVGNYRFTGGDPLLQSIYGIYPEGKAIEDPILGDESGASLSLAAYVRESARKVWKASFSTPYLNPFVEPGQVIEVVDYATRQQATRWVVELVVFIWTGRQWSMRIECTRGEQ